MFFAIGFMLLMVFNNVLVSCRELLVFTPSGSMYCKQVQESYKESISDFKEQQLLCVIRRDMVIIVSFRTVTVHRGVFVSRYFLSVRCTENKDVRFRRLDSGWRTILIKLVNRAMSDRT